MIYIDFNISIFILTINYLYYYIYRFLGVKQTVIYCCLKNLYLYVITSFFNFQWIIFTNLSKLILEIINNIFMFSPKQHINSI